MSRIVGYTRILVDHDSETETATLHANRAIAVFADTSTDWPTSTPELDTCLATLSEGDTLLVTSAARLAPSATRFTRALAGISARGILRRAYAQIASRLDDVVSAGAG